MNVNAETEKLDDSNWGDILDSIKDGKCVLFVGPETVMRSPGISYHEELVKSLAFQNKYFRYLERDEMFLPAENKYRGTLVSRFKKFCLENTFFDDTYKKISVIPFSTIILMTRYPFLIKVFENEHIPFQHRYFTKTYDRSAAEVQIETPSAEVPLIYNIFGNIEKDESLLLTHSDLFDYLQKILNEDALPLVLRALVNSSAQIIFLGFRFDRWYVQLLLRLFKLNSSDASFDRKATMSGDQEDIINICETEFQMKFIGDNIESFVNILYNKCIEGGIELRKPRKPDTGIQTKPDADQQFQNEFNKLLEINDFDAALKKLKEFEEKNNFPLNYGTQLTGRWNEIKSNRTDGILFGEQLNGAQNGLRKSIEDAFKAHFQSIKNNL